MAKDAANVRQRRVARTVRRWRTAQGLTLEEVGSRLRWSDSKLSRFERAEVIAGPAEIIALAAVLGIDEAIRDKAVALALAASTTDGPWRSFGRDALSGDFADFVEDESEAVEVRTVETLLVTGLVQTELYAEHILRAWDPRVGDELVAERSRVRRQRQARLTNKDKPLRLHTIIHESALDIPVGDSSVMREQSGHLLAMGELPNVTIQVIPRATGAFPGIGTSYHLVSFEEGEAGAVYLENLNDGLYVEDERDVAAYTLNFERLCETALSPDASDRLIEEIMSRGGS